MENNDKKALTPAQQLVQRLNSPETLGKLRAVQTKYLSPDRVLRLLSTSMATNPKLMACSFVSILNSVISATKLGIEIDGRHAHLIPYGSEAKLIIDWKGYVLLGRRNNVTGINAQVVYSEDEFDLVHTEKGTGLVHRPNLKAESRGEPSGVYCSYVIDGAAAVEWMTIREVELVRVRSKAADEGPWVTDYLEMARKTVVRRASKYWPFADVDVNALTVSDFDSAIDIESQTLADDKPVTGQVGTTLVSAERRAELPQGTAPEVPTRRRRIRAEEVGASGAEMGQAPMRQATPAPAASAPAPSPATPEFRPTLSVVGSSEPPLTPQVKVLMDDLTAAGYTFDDLVRAQGNGLIVRGMDLSNVGDVLDLAESQALVLNQCRVAVMRGIAEHRNQLL